MRTGSMRVAEISLPAIRHNVRRVRALTGGAVIAVVKANGYGHGAAIVARAAIEGGAELLGVADLEEALALREAGIDAPILCWLHGVGADFDAAVAQGIEIGVSHLAQLDALAAAAERVGTPATLHFKLDTGLSRNGAGPAEWEALFARGAELAATGTVRIRGIFSHLAVAGEDNDLAQAEQFDTAIALLRATGIDPELIHLAASAATFTSARFHYTAVRIGIAIYGLSPFADRTSADLGLIPAMTLKSEIVALRTVAEGTGVSYGYNHITQGDTTLALVPMGYADGMPRALNGSGATVAIAGRHCPIVGRIGMDQCIVDLGSHARRVSLGEPVVLFGDPTTGVPPVEVWSELMRTINYEIVASIGTRVVRVAVDGADIEAGAGSGAGGSGAGADTDVAVGAGTGAPGGSVAAPGGSVAGAGAGAVRYELADPDRMHDLGVRLGERLSAGDLVILTGPLGGGKTTLTRGIGEGLGVRGPITSPTFVVARTHPSLSGGAPLVHLDAYRLADAAELDDLDLDYDGSVVVAEWGADLAGERDSWIEIVIERPTGAGDAEAGAGSEAAGSGNSGSEGGGSADAEAEDALVEPRVVTITGHGDRWRNGVFA